MIEVVTSGWFTSIQDEGRTGLRHYGVPTSGAMDLNAFHKANQILNNPLNAAVIESMHNGPVLKFSCATNICLTGSETNATLNGKRVKMDAVISIKKGDLLHVGKSKNQVYTYIGVVGGISGQQTLGSQSQYTNITRTEKLRKGDLIPIKKTQSTNEIHEQFAKVRKSASNNTLGVFYGPEFEQLSADQRHIILSELHELSNHWNRMGYRFLANPSLKTSEIITAPVIPGTIQLTPSGQLIALMRDAQTTGGYARVLQLTPNSINRLAQFRPGNQIRFKLTD